MDYHGLKKGRSKWKVRQFGIESEQTNITMTISVRLVDTRVTIGSGFTVPHAEGG